MGLVQKEKERFLDLIKRENEKIKIKIEEVKRNKLELRPELERWLMRNEELEQKLYSQSVALVNMTIIIKDY